MSLVSNHSLHDPEDDHFLADVFEVVSSDTVMAILDADQDSEDGRSQAMWVRFANGDLMLGYFPQGEMYFEVEGQVEQDYLRYETARKTEEIKEEVRKK